MTHEVEQRYGGRTRKPLQDIIEAADHAAALVARGRPAYDEDVMLRFAGEAIASRIGEAVARLDPRLTADHPEIPFRLAKRMRNFMSHHYDRVDPEVVWATLESDMPAFAVQIRNLLRPD